MIPFILEDQTIFGQRTKKAQAEIRLDETTKIVFVIPPEKEDELEPPIPLVTEETHFEAADPLAPIMNSGVLKKVFLILISSATLLTGYLEAEGKVMPWWADKRFWAMWTIQR